MSYYHLQPIYYPFKVVWFPVNYYDYGNGFQANDGTSHIHNYLHDFFMTGKESLLDDAIDHAIHHSEGGEEIERQYNMYINIFKHDAIKIDDLEFMPRFRIFRDKIVQHDLISYDRLTMIHRQHFQDPDKSCRLRFHGLVF